MTPITANTTIPPSTTTHAVDDNQPVCLAITNGKLPCGSSKFPASLPDFPPGETPDQTPSNISGIFFQL